MLVWSSMRARSVPRLATSHGEAQGGIPAWAPSSAPLHGGVAQFGAASAAGALKQAAGPIARLSISWLQLDRAH
jgi:hypothetical protein